jgi:TonB family protein
MAEERAPIFAQETLAPLRPPRRALPFSVLAHIVLLGLLLRGRTPVFVAPSSTLGGVHGASVTHLYWATGSSNLPNASLKEENPHAKLEWNKERKATKKAEPDPLSSSSTQAASAAPSPTAGSPYGSLSEGPSSGEEIRPALPAVTSEPHVSFEDLQGIAEGNVVVEITIDESGRIVNKAVVQSMGPAIDGKVLAALENWHFHPATRDGVPIPSKQDVVYHFKPSPS